VDVIEAAASTLASSVGCGATTDLADALARPGVRPAPRCGTPRPSGDCGGLPSRTPQGRSPRPPAEC
jgi:hypothetical protein